MMDTSNKVKKMERVNVFLKMEIDMKDTGITIISMEMDNTTL